MNEKQLATHTGTLESIARKWGVIDAKHPKKYTQYELASLVDALLASNYRRLEKAKRVYREQVTELEKVKQEQLWRFGKFNEAPPDFRAEYIDAMRRKS